MDSVATREFPAFPTTFPKQIDEGLVLGLDLGIGSCGQALVHRSPEKKTVYKKLDFPGRLVFLGVRCFDVPEKHEKSGVELKNAERREKRQLRKNTRRRKQRLDDIRRLLANEGLLPEGYDKEKHPGEADPWQWRVDALERKLTAWEWGAVLIHYAKHRGFQSNKKSDKESKGKEGGTLASASANRQRLNRYETVAQMKCNDEAYRERKRNRAKIYTATVYRADLLNEVEKVFEKQREFGNPHAGEDFEKVYLKQMNRRRSLQPVAHLLESKWHCQFEPGNRERQ